MKFVLPLLIAALLTGCATRSPAPIPAFPPDEARLVTAMARRLALAREVAWIKYLDARPVRDPARESQVLDDVAAAASARGLDAGAARAFFAAQIAASCAQQEKLIHLWKRGVPLPTYAPRTSAEIRREIDATNRGILDALAKLPALPKSLRPRAGQTLRRQGVFWEPSRLATAPLSSGAMRAASSRSDRPSGNTSPDSPSVQGGNTALH